MKTRTSLMLCVLAVLGLVAIQPAQAALLGNWKMDENTGTAVNDSSGNSQNAALWGGGLPTWVAGRTGLTGDYALNFPQYPAGDSKSAALRQSAVTNLGGATNFTITFWARELGGAYYGHWLVAGSASTGGTRNWLGQNGTTGDTQNYLGYNNGNFLNTGRNLPANTWTFVAVTYDNAGGTTRTKIYLDTTMTQHNWGISFPTHASFFIGGWDASGSNFIGDMDDVSVWNETLSTAKINIMKNITTVNTGALKDYGVDNMKTLFDVYATGTPAWVDGTELWAKFTGGTGTAGAVTYTGGDYYAFFDGTSGVKTPEPATLALMGLGGLGLILSRKRR